VDKRSEPDREMEREELSGAVADALGDLPRDWRRTLSLHFLEGFAPTEIADLLETSEDQVRQDLESSLAFLRARLK
jgi:RNA polymerase sigma factor (sigma-70 family)